MKRVPKRFEEYFNSVMFAETVTAIKETTAKLIKTVKELFDEIAGETLEKPVPTKDNLRGTYEEVWSNWKNKIQYAAEHRDVLLAFSAGVSCQNFYDMMHRERGTVSINLMKHFNAKDLVSFAAAFEEAMEMYKKEYDKLQLQELTYNSIDAFRKDYLGLISD